jgi:hypothetical protein
MSLVGGFTMLSMLMNTMLNGRALTAKWMEGWGATTAETNCYTERTGQLMSHHSNNKALLPDMFGLSLSEGILEVKIFRN